MPSGRFAANGAWLAVQVMAHNLARWTARIGLGEQIVTTKTLRRRVFALAGRLHPLGTPPHPGICHSAGHGRRPSSVAPSPGCEPFHSQPDGARPLLTRHPGQPNVPANSRHSGPRVSLAASYPSHLPHHKPL